MFSVLWKFPRGKSFSRHLQLLLVIAFGSAYLKVNDKIKRQTEIGETYKTTKYEKSCKKKKKREEGRKGAVKTSQVNRCDEPHESLAIFLIENSFFKLGFR